MNPLAIEHRNTPDLGNARVVRRTDAGACPTRTRGHVRQRQGTGCRLVSVDGERAETAYEARLSKMGDVDGARDIGCTSHFSVVDRDGMVVSQTQTLLSVFGSMVTFLKVAC